MATPVSTRINRLQAITQRTVATNLQAGLTIGGFELGADYVRDLANTFGMASTVTGGDDVRFWAGDTFANRATAPMRIYESGAVYFGAGTFAGDIHTAGFVYATGGYASSPDGFSAAIHGYLTGETTNNVNGVVGFQNDASGWGNGVIGISKGSGAGGLFSAQGSGDSITVSAAFGTGYGLTVYGNASKAAILINAGAGQNAITAVGGAALLAAGATAYSSLRIPHGSAPTSPVNGDIWTTAAGIYCRINGATVGPLT